MDQVGLGGHHAELVARCRAGSGRPPSVRPVLGSWTRNVTRARLLDEQHVPGEAVALARPAVVARVGEVAQRQGELHDHPQRRPAPSSTGERTHRPRPAAPRPVDPSGRAGGAASRARRTPCDAPIISQGKTPIGNSAQVHTWNATSTSQAANRVRRHSRSGTMRQSNSGAGDRRRRGASPRCRPAARAPARRRGPGATARAAARARSQSAWSLASPAKA